MSIYFIILGLSHFVSGVKYIFCSGRLDTVYSVVSTNNEVHSIQKPAGVHSKKIKPQKRQCRLLQ